jgi:hypothetical protein
LREERVASCVMRPEQCGQASMAGARSIFQVEKRVQDTWKPFEVGGRCCLGYAATVLQSRQGRSDHEDRVVGSGSKVHESFLYHRLEVKGGDEARALECECNTGHYSLPSPASSKQAESWRGIVSGAVRSPVT